MAIFSNTLRVISWCESLPSYFQQKHDEYQLLSCAANLSYNAVSIVSWGIGYFVKLSPKEEEQVNLSKAQLTIQSKAYEYMSKLAQMFSYIVQPLTLGVLLPIAITVDLCEFVINGFASIFKNEPVDSSNINPKANNNFTYNSADEKPVFREHRLPKVLNAFGAPNNLTSTDRVRKNFSSALSNKP